MTCVGTNRNVHQNWPDATGIRESEAGTSPWSGFAGAAGRTLGMNLPDSTRRSRDPALAWQSGPGKGLRSQTVRGAETWTQGMSDSASKLVRVQVRFVGRVQGVGFRATCRDIASGHAVTGWVRNEADGSVVLEAQGSAEAVEVYLRAVEATMGRFIGSAARMGVTALEGEKRFEIRR